MGWFKNLFGIKEKTQLEKDSENYAMVMDYEKKIKESPYRNITVLDMKLGRIYNTGEFHTKMPNE